MVSRKAYRQKKRPGRHRHAKKILLIAVEGKNKTERNYFQYIANSNVDVHIVPGNETDPVSMAKHMLDAYEGQGLLDSDYAACLVDSDFDVQKDVQLQEADKLIEQARVAKHQNVNLIQSAPCFEIWYICHFAYTTRNYAKTAEVMEELERYIPGYKKGQEQAFIQTLEGRNQQAIQRAKRLQKYCEEDRKRPHHVEFMPSTEVYRIFEDFLLKKSKES